MTQSGFPPASGRQDKAGPPQISLSAPGARADSRPATAHLARDTASVRSQRPPSPSAAGRAEGRGPLDSGVETIIQAFEQSVADIRFHHAALENALRCEKDLAARVRRLLVSAIEAAPSDDDQERLESEVRPATSLRKSTSVQERTGSPSGARQVAVERAETKLAVYFLGQFRVLQNDRPADGWANGKSKAVFKYLVKNRRQLVPKDVLMQLFWPEAEVETARNNLNVAVYGLRKTLGRSLPDFSHVLFHDGGYRLNPELSIWSDVEAFEIHVRKARDLEHHDDLQGAARAYREAESLYQGPLLVEDRYEEWLLPERARLQELALDSLRHLCRVSELCGDMESTVNGWRRLLEIDRCDEAAHRELMQLYSRTGQSHLALRQFHACAEALERDLHMIPSPQTVALFHQIRRRDPA